MRFVRSVNRIGPGVRGHERHVIRSYWPVRCRFGEIERHRTKLASFCDRSDYEMILRDREERVRVYVCISLYYLHNKISNLSSPNILRMHR